MTRWLGGELVTRVRKIVSAERLRELAAGARQRERVYLAERARRGQRHPILVPRIGPCIQACNECGRVCPTGAIEACSLEEKRHLYLGTASVDRSRCLAWAFGDTCVVCQESCPYQAIHADVGDNGVPRPVVDDRICVGCGMCEHVCPVEPDSAIRVYSSGDRRHWTREEQREFRGQVEQESAGASPYPGL